MPSLLRGFLCGERPVCSYECYVRDYLYVKAAAAALRACLFSDYIGAVNVAGGARTTIGEIARTAAAVCGGGQAAHKPLEACGGQPMCVQADVSRLRSLGWVPRYTLEAGLREQAHELRGQVRP